MFRELILASLLVAGASLSGVAVAAPQPFPLNASPAEFREQADVVRREMASGGKYAQLPAHDRQKVGKQLEVLQKLYDKRQGGASLNHRDEVTLVNATEEINALLSGNDDAKLVCEYERKLGSNRRERVCMTVAERRQAQDDARHQMRRALDSAEATKGL